MGVCIKCCHACAVGFPRVFGHQQFLPDQHALDVLHAVHAAAEADFQIGRHFRFFRCAHRQLAAVIGRGWQNQLLGLDFVPRLIAGHAVAAVFLCAVVVAHPMLGQAVELVDVVDFGKAQAAFKGRLHNIVGFFHLPLGAWVARLVNLHMHIQRLTQIFKRCRSIRAAGVKHHHPWHAAKRVFQGILLGLHHVDKEITQVRAGLATEVILHSNRAAGMVGAGVSPYAVLLNLHHVFRLVFVKLFLFHHPQPRVLAVSRQVIQHTQARVDLPAMVRVFRFHAADRVRLQKLVGVQLVFTQGAGDGRFRKRHHFAGFLINPSRFDFAVGAKHFHRLPHRHQPLAVSPHGFHQHRRNQLGFIKAQLRLARIAAAFAFGLHRHRFQLAVERGQAHAQFRRLLLQIGTFLAAPHTFRLPVYRLQTFD